MATKSDVKVEDALQGVRQLLLEVLQRWRTQNLAQLRLRTGVAESALLAALNQLVKAGTIVRRGELARPDSLIFSTDHAA